MEQTYTAEEIPDPEAVVRTCPDCDEAMTYQGTVPGMEDEDDDLYNVYECPTCHQQTADRIVEWSHELGYP